MKSAKKMRIVSILTVIFLFLVLVLFWGSLKITGHFLRADKISNLLKNQTGLEFQLENLKIGAKFNLTLAVDFDDLKILTPENKTLLEAGDSSFEIKILPLIVKKVVLKKLDSDSVKLNILREKDGKFEFEKYFNPQKKTDFTFDLKNGKIEIKNYEINLIDKFLNSSSIAQGADLTAQKTKDLLELKTEGTIKTKKDSASYEIDLKTKLPYKKYLANKNFKFNVSLKNLDISQYSGYFKDLKDLKDMKGIFDVQILKNDDKGDNKIGADILIKNLEIPSQRVKVKAAGDITISASALLESDFIKIENFTLLGEKIDITGKGKISDYKNKKPELDLEFRIKDTGGKNTIALLPDLIPTPENSIFKLKKYAADGILNGTITVGGKAPRPIIKGKGTYKDVTILNKKLKIPTSYGDIEFFGDWAKMDARAFVDKGQYIDVKGSFGLYRNRKADFEIVSSKNFNVKNAQILLLPIQDIIGFKTGPVPVMDLSGKGTIDLKTSGSRESAVLYGFFELNDIRAQMLDGFNTPIEKASGKILFNKDKITFNAIKGKLNTADLTINGNADVLGNVSIEFISKNLSNKDVWQMMKDNFEPNIVNNYAIIDKIKFQASATLGFKHKFNPNDLYTPVQPKDLGFFGKATIVNSPNSDVYFHSGEVILKDNKAYFNNIDTRIFNADILANFTVDKVFDIPPQQITNGKITVKNFDAGEISEAAARLANANVQKILSHFSNFSGKLNGVLLITNNNLSGKLDLEGIRATDKNNTPVKVNSGQIEARNNKLVLSRLDMNYGTVPFYLNANINDIYSENSSFDIHFTTSLNEENVDTLINPNLSYPLKINGEMGLKGMLKGNVSDYTLYLKANLEPQNDISYMGANLGDKELKREIRSNINFKGNVAKINNFEYLKYVSSQNNKLTPVPVFRVFGDIIRTDKNNVSFGNFNIKTQNPATARIFNIAFKKSILKQGQFNCNMVLNGDARDLRVLGNIDFSDINIPIYNSKIKDAQLNFKGNSIYASLSGKAFESDVNIVSEIKNDLRLPIVVKKLDITSLKTDISKIINELSSLGTNQKGVVLTSKDQIVFGPGDIIIEEGIISAADVTLYDIKAKNFSGKFNNLLGAPFKFYDTSFDIAGGKIVSEGTFDFDTTKLTLNSKIENCEASVLSQSFLGISNQIFGKTNGEISLTGSRLNTLAGLKTVEARANFNIENGKMPRLGSLEYLIRAGNIYKSGILGLTINNIIEVLIPYKTGEFSRIKGIMLVQSGIIEKLEILSRGENLSIFVHGKYDLVNDAADIEVLGRLSKNVSNLLGPIGNASFNSILGIFGGKKKNNIEENELIQNINKIPLIEISQNDYRIFSVKIVGDLNKEGYVKTFNWLN